LMLLWTLRSWSLCLSLSLLFVIHSSDRTIFVCTIYLLSCTLPRFSHAYI
jgi:hypothetical protein